MTASDNKCKLHNTPCCDQQDKQYHIQRGISLPPPPPPPRKSNSTGRSFNSLTLVVFHTQLNGTNTTYLDVCPLLEPSPSTPTGDYVQPVNVARDIELQTRSLPAPVSFNLWCLHSLHVYYMFHLLPMQISGFRYICSLRGTVNLTTVYNNESSLTCRVNQNQVMHSKYDIIIPIIRGL